MQVFNLDYSSFKGKEPEITVKGSEALQGLTDKLKKQGYEVSESVDKYGFLPVGIAVISNANEALASPDLKKIRDDFHKDNDFSKNYLPRQFDPDPRDFYVGESRPVSL